MNWFLSLSVGVCVFGLILCLLCLCVSLCLSVCSFLVSKFSHFSLFQPSLFIQYSTEECSTVQLLANSLDYPQRMRIEWSQCLNSVSVCLFVCLSVLFLLANFLIFP